MDVLELAEEDVDRGVMVRVREKEQVGLPTLWGTRRSFSTFSPAKDLGDGIGQKLDDYIRWG
jgi:hypothetical protein